LDKVSQVGVPCLCCRFLARLVNQRHPYA
jgi:hypothetical protein